MMSGASSSRCSAARRRLAARGTRAAGERVRRIGVLMRIARTIRNFRSARGVSAGACRSWAGPSAATCGSTRVGAQAMPRAVRKHAAEVGRSAPDVILADGSSTVAPLQQPTRTVPIVFVAVPDPVGAGFVDSLARPGGNATGFMLSNTAEREMAGAAQGDRAECDASGGPSGSRHHRRC